jgi:2-polyprenyl-6-methoxyphenol hydroxylase-like FAD-dependent oxidoreductase
MLKENEEIAYDPMIAYHKHTGERIAGPLYFKELLSTNVRTEMMPKRIYRHSRPKFHAMLLGQLQKIGIEVEYGNEVVDYFENGDDGKAGVVLKDGSRHEADLVVAADGVRGNSWPLVAGHPVPARSSGHAIFRVAYPIENALADPMIAERFPLLEDGRSVIEMWVG